MTQDELREGIESGRYLFLDVGWIVRSQITGDIVALIRRPDRLWVVSFSKVTRLWRLQPGVLEGPGMHGVKWFAFYRESIVQNLASAFEAVEQWRDA